MGRRRGKTSGIAALLSVVLIVLLLEAWLFLAVICAVLALLSFVFGLVKHLWQAWKVRRGRSQHRARVAIEQRAYQRQLEEGERARVLAARQLEIETRQRQERIDAHRRERERVEEELANTLKLANVDEMTGPEFEQYVVRLLRRRGFKAERTGGSGDGGVDIVASHSGVRYAVQCKRCATAVSRRAVSDAVGGLRPNQCTRGMVITNSRFTKGAMHLARENDCLLVDRDALAAWILAYQTPQAAVAL